MFRPAIGLGLLAVLFLLSCGRVSRTEQEETAYWNALVLDSSFRLLYKKEDTTQALRYYDSVVRPLKGLPPYPGAVRYMLKANYYYFFTPDNQQTASLIDTALAFYPTPELRDRYPRTYVGLLLFGGQIAYRLQQYSKANEYYFRAKKLGEVHLDPCEQAAFHYNIAMVLYRQENFDQALHYFEEAYRLQATCAPPTTAIVLQQQEIQSNIGLCLVQLEKYDRAMAHFDRAVQIAESYRDSLGAATMDKIYGVVYGHQAQVLLATGRLAEAGQLSLRSIALNDRPGYEVEHARGIKLQLAEVYRRKNDFARMAAVLSDLNGVGAPAPGHMQEEWNRLMAAYHEQTGQPAAALRYFRRYAALKDSTREKQRLLQAADVDRQLMGKEQERQIAVLKKDRQLTELMLGVTIVFSGMAVGIIMLVYQNYRRSKKNLALSLALNEEVRRQKAAREEETRQRHKLITEAVIRAQENERSLIGLELHDGVNQVLTTVKLQTEMALEGVGDPKAILPRAMHYLQECINEIRSLSKRLSAPTLGKISLEESVKDLIGSINETSKVKIHCRIEGLENRVLQQDVHLGVYRILQEQLNNVLKHAAASEVWVELECRNGAIRLWVTDDGKGFVLQNTGSGIGLMNMQTRAESLNGTFTLDSQPGHGCRVEVVVPCLG
jgi:signal transduction histidine kinase